MNRLQALLIFVVGGAVGALATYAITKKQYDAELQSELDEMANFYQKRESRIRNDASAEAFKNVGTMVVDGFENGLETTIVLDGEVISNVEDIHGAYDEEKTVVPALTERLNKDKENINLYKKVVDRVDYSAPSKRKKPTKSTPIVLTEAPEEYFEPKSDEEMGGPDDGWQTAEDEYNNPKEPYLIDEETFSETCLEYPKVAITLYADEVLLDEDESIMNIADTIGHVPAAFNYDYGNVAFVRNSKLGIDYEVERRDTLYSEVVAGFGRLND